MKKIMTHILAFAAGAAVCAAYHRHTDGRGVVTLRDTVTVRMPAARDTVRAVRYVRIAVPHPLTNGCVACVESDDTARAPDSLGRTLTLAAESRHYHDTLYDAWVSGVDARLDSLRINRHAPVLSAAKSLKNSRWSIGITAGMGWTGRGLAPFVGVGVSWNIVNL